MVYTGFNYRVPRNRRVLGPARTGSDACVQPYDRLGVHAYRVLVWLNCIRYIARVCLQPITNVKASFNAGPLSLTVGTSDTVTAKVEVLDAAATIASGSSFRVKFEVLTTPGGGAATIGAPANTPASYSGAVSGDQYVYTYTGSSPITSPAVALLSVLVTGTTPGLIRVRATADSLGAILENNELDNTVEFNINIVSASVCESV